MNTTILMSLLILSLASCATFSRVDALTDLPTISALEEEGAIATPNGKRINIKAFNQLMAERASGYYCAGGSCDKVPELVSGNAPVYPSSLIMASVTGHITVVFTIDEFGSVVDPRVESTSNFGFSGPTMRAIKTWKFKPASLAGKPIRFTSRQHIQFELR